MTIEEIMNMTRDQINTRIAELDALVETAGQQQATEEAVRQVNEADAERRMLQSRRVELEEQECRQNAAAALTSGKAVGTVLPGMSTGGVQETVIEKRANALVATGRMEIRQLLSTGTLTPTAVRQEIGELPQTMSSIVDDVNSFDATGCGAWTYAYRKSNSAAVAVTEGETIGGTPGEFDTGVINPTVWGILDEISNQVKMFTPLAYEASIRNNAYLALRRYAKREIVRAILDSDLVDKVEGLAIDQDFLRTLVLGFNCDEGVAGGAKLYLTKASLAKVGKVRGTSEKKALYEIKFSDENNGTITEGGLSVNFSILSDLGDTAVAGEGADTADVMIYGQMKSVDMPLWGNYTITTNEGGDYFKRNVMGIRGLQTAGAGVTRPHTVQVINGVNP